MKKIIIVVLLLVLVIIGGTTFIKKINIGVGETTNEGLYETVPSDPIEYIYYQFGEDTKVYTCQQPVEIDEANLIAPLPNSLEKDNLFIKFVFGVTEDNYAVGQSAGLYGVDKNLKNNTNIENHLNGPSGAQQVLTHSFSKTELISEDEYDLDNIIPYESWEACAKQISLPTNKEVPTPRGK